MMLPLLSSLPPPLLELGHGRAEPGVPGDDAALEVQAVPHRALNLALYFLLFEK